MTSRLKKTFAKSTQEKSHALGQELLSELKKDPNEYDRDKVLKLIHDGADIHVKDEYGWAPLVWATVNGYLDVVKELAQCGADVNAQDKEDWTVLMRATYCGYLDIVKELVRCGANIDFKNNEDCTALILAEEEGHYDIEEYFLTEEKDRQKAFEERQKAIEIKRSIQKKEILDALDQGTQKPITVKRFKGFKNQKGLK